MEENNIHGPFPGTETDTSSELNRDRVKSGAPDQHSEMPERPAETGHKPSFRQTARERGQTDEDQNLISVGDPVREQKAEPKAADYIVSAGTVPEKDTSAAAGVADRKNVPLDDTSAAAGGADSETTLLDDASVSFRDVNGGLVASNDSPAAAGRSDGRRGNGQPADAGDRRPDGQPADAWDQRSDSQPADAGDQYSDGRPADAGDRRGNEQSEKKSDPRRNEKPAGAHRQQKKKQDFAGAESGDGKHIAHTVSGIKKEKAARKVTSYEEKLLRHKRRIYRRTIFLVAIVTAAVVTAVILWMRRGYTRAELTRITAFTAADGTEYENLNGDLVRYSSSGAVCTDRRGNTRWSVSYEMQEPITSVSGDVIAIANRSGYNVYVMNSEGLIGTIETMLPIHSIAAAENGEVAVIMNDSKAAWIRLYTGEGKEIAYIVQTMAENGYPVAAAVSPDGRMLSLSSIQLSNAAVKSNVSFYNFGKQGQKAVDHRVDYSDFIDEVVPYVRYMGDSVCAGISDKRLILFRKTLLQKSGSTSILFSESLQGVFSNESFIGLLFNDTKEETQYRLDLYNRRGKKSGSIHFSMQYKDIQIAGDKVYINNAEQCQIYTLSGRCLFNGEFGRPVSALIPGSGLGDLLVVTGGEIDSVRLH